MVGIGDTLRVSLSDEPEEEVRVGWDLLKTLGIRHRGVKVISCPSCARQGFNVIETVRTLEDRLAHIETPLTLSIIGCVVNGPGEALMTAVYRVAPQPHVLARDLVAGIQRQIHPKVFAAAADADFILRHGKGLGTGIVPVADLRENFLGRAAGAGAVARHAGGSDRGLAIDQGGFHAAVSGLRNVVQFGVDLHVARRHRTLRVPEQLDPPIVLCDSIRPVRTTAAEQPALPVISRHARAQSPPRVFLDEFLHAGQPFEIVGVQVDAENARDGRA